MASLEDITMWPQLLASLYYHYSQEFLLKKVIIMYFPCRGACRVVK